MRLLPRLEMTQLIVFVLVLVVAAIAAMIGLNINTSIANSMADCTTAGTSFDTATQLCQNASNATVPTPYAPGNLEWNASRDTAAGISNITEQFPNIGLVVAAVVIIGLLIGGFAFAFRGGGGF